jgi:hypothetical protein
MQTPPPPAPPAPPAAADAAALAARLLAFDDSDFSVLQIPQAAWRRLAPHNVTRPTMTIDSDGGAMTLAILRRDGSWEAPRGNSAPQQRTPIIDGVELIGPGTLQVVVPDDAVTLRVRKAPGLANIERQDDSDHVVLTTFVRGPHRFYVERGDSVRPFYVARFTGRAPFHVNDDEVRTLEKQLLGLAMAMANSDPFGTAAADYLAAHHADVRREVPPPAPPPGVLARKAQAPARTTYDLGVAELALINENVVSVTFRAPVTLPGLFAALDMQRVRTSFAHDAGELPQPVVGKGVTINMGSYAMLRDFEGHAEDGLLSEARLRSIVLSSAAPTR